MNISHGGGTPEFVINVKDARYNAKGDNSTNDTTAINAAIAVANAVATNIAQGAIVFFPPGMYIVTSTLTTPTKGVRLLGCDWVWGTAHYSASTLKLTTNSTPLFSLGNGVTSNITFEKLSFVGAGGTDLTHRAIYAVAASLVKIIDCNFDQWGGSAFRVDGGADVYLANIQATNSLLGYASLADYAGVFEIGATETRATYCNINGHVLSATRGDITAKGFDYLCAWYVKTSLAKFDNCYGAFAHHGYYFNYNQLHEITNCRAEYNQGHGFFIKAIKSKFMGCRAQDNSRDVSATYSGFKIGATGVTGYENSFSDCIVGNIVDGTYLHKYGFDVNSSAGATFALRNIFRGNHIRLNDTGNLYNFAGNTPYDVDPINMIQAQTGIGARTFDGQLGNKWFLTVNANTATSITAANLLLGVPYILEIYNGSGAAPAITLDAALFRADNYVAPANGLIRSGIFHYDGVHLVSDGKMTGDF